MKHLATLLWLMAWVVSAAGSGHGEVVVLPKQVNAPPSDFGLLTLPSPGAHPAVSTHAVVRVGLDGDGLGAVEVPVVGGAGASGLRVALVVGAGEEAAWAVWRGGAEMRAAGEEVYDAEFRGAATRAEVRTFGAGEVARGIGEGSLTVRVRGAANGEALVVVADGSGPALRSHAIQHGAVVGRSIGVSAMLGEGGARIVEAGMRVDGPRGEAVDIAMVAGEGGVVSGSFVAREAGAHYVTITVRGEAVGGRAVLRTTHHRFDVAEAGLGVDRARFARATADGEGVFRVDVPVSVDDPDRRVLVAGEVWGTSAATGAWVPVCWAATVTSARVAGGAMDCVALRVDGRWLGLAGVGAGGVLELRAVRLHDPGTMAVLDEVGRVDVAADAGVAAVARRGAVGEIDESMLRGRPRGELALSPTVSAGAMERAREAGRAFGAHNLLLSHGWCAGGNPWPPGDFSGFTEYFSDPDANRTHDEFAQLLLAFGSNSKSYGIVGHSQGGNAALHLWTFYFSGLDWAEGDRLIQSVGTPYQGTPLASFGFFTCGVNNDLTPSGAAAWLSTIPSASRAAVHYWTTSPSSGACSGLANLFLSSPNDGVIEVSRGQLVGGVSMGNVLGWCHTTGMNQPAHYTDSARNAEMNANAAR